MKLTTSETQWMHQMALRMPKYLEQGQDFNEAVKSASEEYHLFMLNMCSRFNDCSEQIETTVKVLSDNVYHAIRSRA